MNVLANSEVAPVAFFYNVANGFRNMPSYLITNEVHRQRDEIIGFGSGLSVASTVCPISLCKDVLTRYPRNSSSASSKHSAASSSTLTSARKEKAH